MTYRGLVLQYEVHLYKVSACGGSYVELLTEYYVVETVIGTTSYSFMIGSDRRYGGPTQTWLIRHHWCHGDILMAVSGTIFHKMAYER